MPIHFRLILTSVFMLASYSVSAQFGDALHTQLFNEEHGLSGNTVYDFVQDRNGFMWIATTNGLSRFDGKSFLVFRKDFNNTNSLADNMITRLAVDSLNRIWIGYASEGISCYDQISRSFKHFMPDTAKPKSILTGTIDELFIDSDGKIWIGIARQGLMLFNEKEESFKWLGMLPHVSKERSLNSQQHYNRLTHIVEDSDGIIWLGTGDGLYSLEKRKQKFNVFRIDQGPENIHEWKKDVFNTICLINDSVFFLAGWGTGLNKYDRRNNKWTNYLLNPAKPHSGNNNIINFIEKKNDNELWVASNDTNICIFNIAEERFYHLTQEQVISNRLKTIGARALYSDRSGDLWLGHNAGFHILSRGKSDFDFIPVPVTFSNNNNFYNVTHVYKDSISGQLLFSTSWADGLNVVKPDGSRKNLIYGKIPVEKDFQLGSMVFNDSRDTLWVLSRDFIHIYDRKNMKLVDISQPVPDTSTSGSPFYANMKEDKNGNLWISTFRHGLYVFDRETKTYSQIVRFPDKQQSLLSNIIQAFTFDNNGDVWIGYKTHGVTHYRVKEGTFTHYRSQKGNINTLIDDRVLCMATDRNGHIIVGTFSGISVLNPSSDPATVNNFFKEQEFLGITVSDIIIDDSDNVWMSTSKGLLALDSSDETVKKFSYTSGPHNINEFIFFSKAFDGELYIGTHNGYFKFRDSLLNKKGKPAEVFITSFRSGDYDVKFETALNTNGKINLAASENLFTVEFVSINFRDPGTVSYRYRLQGLDQTWRSTGTRGFASYNNLSGGNFIFEVQAMHFGEWSNITSLPIFIATPFYKTPWFNIGVALLFAGSIYSLYQYRIRTIEKTEAIKTQFNKKLAETEMRALRAQMNPHFIFNCLNSINRYIIKNDHKTASLYLTKFAKLIRIILDNSETPEVALSQELEALHLYIDIEALRFDHRFRYEIEVDDEISTDSVMIPPMIIQPFIENAIWHGLLHKDSPGSLKIIFTLEDQLLVCVVEDDGIGRKQAQELKSKSATTRKSLGLKITHDRLELLNAKSDIKGGVAFEDLVDPTGEPAGTRVIIKIPVDI